jgi:hypothetical protein
MVEQDSCTEYVVAFDEQCNHKSDSLVHIYRLGNLQLFGRGDRLPEFQNGNFPQNGLINRMFGKLKLSSRNLFSYRFEQ